MTVFTVPSANAVHEYDQNTPNGFWHSKCPQNGGTGEITWTTNSKEKRVELTKEVFNQVDNIFTNYTFKYVPYPEVGPYNVDIFVGYSAEWRSRGVAGSYTRWYSPTGYQSDVTFGNTYYVYIYTPLDSDSDSIVEYILSHEVWHGVGAGHIDADWRYSLMNPLWNWERVQLNESGQIGYQDPTDAEYLKHIDHLCTIDFYNGEPYPIYDQNGSTANFDNLFDDSDDGGQLKQVIPDLDKIDAKKVQVLPDGSVFEKEVFKVE